MQLFMSFYFWTLHLIRRLIYSKHRQNLQDCNKPGAHSWLKRSQWHTVCSPSIARATAACWVPPGQCHQLQHGPPQVPTTPSPLGEDKKCVPPHPVAPKSLQCPPSDKYHHHQAILVNFGIIHPVAGAPVCWLVMWKLPAKGTFHGLFNVSW